jgi:tetratricopeptide (TPR) repeat protein
MTELFSLVNGLHPEEIKAIKGSFKRVDNDDDALFVQELFTIILSERGNLIPDKELSIVLYGKEKLSAVAKLKSRLFQYILEILSSDKMLSKEQLFDPADKQIIRIRKKMLQYRVIYRKKNKTDITVLSHLLSEIIKEAKEHEQYDILTEALYFKKNMLLIRKGFSEVKQIEKQIELYTYAYKAVLKANDYYFELITNQDLLKQRKPDEIKGLLKEAIIEIENYIKITDSASIKYICKLLQLDELIRENKHETCIDTCLDILNILNNYKHLYRMERIGFVYDNISLCQVYKKDFNNAILSVEKAQQYYSPDSFSYMISKQQEFIACFYGSAYNRAYSIILELLKLPIINAGEFRHDKYLFFEASTLFKLGNYRSAINICNQALEISKDKGRWDIGIRYLQVMCFVELLQYDQAYSSIEAFRKVISRSNDKDICTLRDELIYRALNEFASTAFSNIPTPKLIEIIENLSSKDSVNSWNYYSHELIPVNKWIESKIKSKKTAPEVFILK